MTDNPPFWAKPDNGLVPFRVRPRLASWMASDHPDQIRLEEFLADTHELLQPRLEQLADPLALRLDVGLPLATPLLEQHDLDNYLFPLATKLSKLTGRQLASVWGTKQHAETSFIGIAQATPVAGRMALSCTFKVHTNTSSQSAAYKQQIHEQLADAAALPDGAVSLQLGFSVGPRRNWLNLWKPTIDALDQILGRTTSERQWHPRDGRIVELGLHRHVEPTLGNDIAITIEATTVQ